MSDHHTGHVTYEAPHIAEVGSVRELTQGQGFNGHADSFLFFSWGQPASQ